MGVLRKISKGFETFLSWMDGVASISIAAIMVLITADVISRLCFNKPFTGTAEIVSMMIIVVCFLEIPYVTVRKAHVRTTTLYDKVNRVGKLLIDIFSSVLGVIAYYLILVSSWPGLMKAIKINEVEIAGSFRITTLPGRIAIIIGCVLMILEFVNQIVQYIVALKTGKEIEKGEVTE